MNDLLDPHFLKERMATLDWTTYRLAQEVARIRKEVWGEEIDFRQLINGLNKTIENPEGSSGKQLEAVILALGGTLEVTWISEVIVKRKTKEKINLSKEFLNEQSN